MGDCQNYGPFLGPYYNRGPNTGPNLGDPKRDHNFDNHPNVHTYRSSESFFLGFRAATTFQLEEFDSILPAPQNYVE